MTRQTWKHFAFMYALLGEVMNASLSLAQDRGKFLGLKGGGRLANAGVKSCAMLATLTLALSVVSVGAARAAANTVEPLPKTTAGPQDRAPRVKRLPIAQQRETWRRSMLRTPLPKKGCFTATYQETKWREVQCKTPPNRPYPPKHGIRPQTVGNGTEFSSEVTANTSQADGSFDSVKGVTSETTGGAANAFSLQLNSNFFPTTTCSGAANPATCQGWEQFMFSNTFRVAFIQYWLLHYGPSGTACPAFWTPHPIGNEVYCFTNSPIGAPVPAQAITSLGQMKLDGAVAAVIATDDAVTLAVGNNIYTATGGNYFPDLTNGWRISEFNVFGDGSGSQATFNSGSIITVRTAVNSGTPALPPSCTQQGFTSETNNLNLVSAPVVYPDVAWPSIVFTESNAGGGMASCATAESLGDTHLTTFNGLLYDFQASGDFVLAKDGSDFVVQARQASWAPNPNVSVNKAVATQMGNTRVAAYIEPTRLVIDGQSNDLADGKTLLLPSGVQVSRGGNMYVITSESGDSVRAVLNSTWMDLTVGLGHAHQTQASGLLGNPNGNAQELATSNGTVLGAPVSFTDLYHSYADSWRVQPNESLFGEATTIKPGIPDKPFYARHLNPQEYARARATCKAAGVKTQALLDACTLDTAVLNDETAVKVFVHAPRPRVVIKPVLRLTR